MREYTDSVLLLVGLIAVLDLAILRTRLLLHANYWLTLVVVAIPNYLLDALLTRPNGSVMFFDNKEIRGPRLWPNIPLENIVFYWALMSLALVLWTYFGKTREA